MKEVKNVALVAHDNRKKDLVEWVEWNYQILLNHNLICTGTTGLMIEKVILRVHSPCSWDLYWPVG